MIRAIETRYRGYRFRSRLEARHAVLLDRLSEPWEYEREGFTLPSGRYLPDFWLPRVGAWLEVKGQAPSDRDLRRLVELQKFSRSLAVLSTGLPDNDRPNLLAYLLDQSEGSASRGWQSLRWAMISSRLTFYPVMARRGSSREFYLPDVDTVAELSDVGVVSSLAVDLDRGLLDAARAARFEFGEAG